MKRPVTLLCLSDLHLVDQNVGKFAIDQLKTALYRLAESDCRLRPDYIVMAGDLIDAKEDRTLTEKYQAVHTWVELLRTDPAINIPKFNVIAVPGNHDKLLLNEVKADDHKKADTLLKAMNSQSLIDWKAIEAFEDNFRHFGDFYKYYLNSECDSCFFEPSLCPPQCNPKKQTSVETTSGIKVFLQDKICFLCLNTEWFYLQDKIQSLPISLCSPLVYNSLKRIQLKYPDFTIVTIMHRNPTSLSWNEINGNSTNMPDILRYLYTYSDIIIAGHEHTERLLPPHRMINRAQLFQLGSVSVDGRQNAIPTYHAAILYLDPIRRTVMSYDLNYNNYVGKWSINNTGLFALADKYIMNTGERSENPFTIVHPKSLAESEIIKAIITSFPGLHNGNFSIICIDVKSEGYLKRIRKTLNKFKRLFVALYTISSADVPLLKERILEVKRTFKLELITQRIILNGVEIAVPIIVNEPL